VKLEARAMGITVGSRERKNRPVTRDIIIIIIIFIIIYRQIISRGKAGNEEELLLRTLNFSFYAVNFLRRVISCEPFL
jgi:hypothetical protein